MLSAAFQVSAADFGLWDTAGQIASFDRVFLRLFYKLTITFIMVARRIGIDQLDRTQSRIRRANATD